VPFRSGLIRFGLMSGRTVNLDRAPKYLDPGMKVGWAKHHLEALDDEVRKYFGSDPYTISRKDDLEVGEHIVQLEIKPITAYMGLILKT
jgi:hypothetical protein